MISGGEVVAEHFPHIAGRRWIVRPYYKGTAKTEAAARKACERALIRLGKRLVRLGGG